MMRQLHAVYGEWLLKDGCWNFVVDHFKGARMLFLSEGSTHVDLVAMAQDDLLVNRPDDLLVSRLPTYLLYDYVLLTTLCFDCENAI